MEALSTLGLALLPSVMLVSLRVGVALVSFPAPFSDLALSDDNRVAHQPSGRSQCL